jgi:glucose/arabinose dehydrogenase
MRRSLIALLTFGLAALLASPAAAQPGGPPGDAAALAKRTVGIRLVAKGLNSPVTLVAAPDGSGRLFVVDQIGKIWIVAPGDKLLGRPFLDLSSKIVPLQAAYDERGLLGLAFHPNYKTNGRLFVYYSVPLRAGGPKGWDHTNRLSEFRVMAGDPNQVDTSSERVLWQLDQPYLNHNGGTVAFGPDGYLYFAIGDGGNANDVGRGHNPKIGNGQDLYNEHGKMLRIDVDHRDPGSQYRLPRDNPFVGVKGLNDVWAYGFRNPYRFSFDRGGDHALYVGDAGQDLWEEVDLVTRGGNYGWNIKEGTHCFDPANSKQSPKICRSTGYNGEKLIDPIIEYGHPGQPSGIGEVVVGGYIYRGSAIGRLQGQYVFADWSKEEDVGDGTLLAAAPKPGGGLWGLTELRIASHPDGRLHHFVLGFGEDDQGELYALVKDTLGPTGKTGMVLRIVP